jgi:uncharacterized protein (UPF0335 family)
MTTFSAPDASSAKQLLSFIERIENLEEEKKGSINNLDTSIDLMKKLSDYLGK